MKHWLLSVCKRALLCYQTRRVKRFGSVKVFYTDCELHLTNLRWASRSQLLNASSKLVNVCLRLF